MAVPACDGVRVQRASIRFVGPGLMAAACLLGWSCGSLPEPTPTEPEPVSRPAPSPEANPNPNPSPVFGAPAPSATPTPEPAPESSPSPPPPDSEGASACGSPTPPALSSLNVKVHLRAGDRWVLDSTPLVGPDPVFCAAIGFPDRATCPVRPEGHPERAACELFVTGRATDTGRPGPTWSLEGRPCAGRASGCENHPDNQYQVLAFAGGLYRACGRNGVCGEVPVDK
jgi:hypothetical protein